MDFVFEGRPSDSPFIEMIWQTHSKQAGTFISEAASSWGIVLTKYQGKTRLVVRGPETKATPADFPADAEFLGIQFKLGTFMPDVPMHTIIDRQDLILPEAGSKSFWFHGSVWQFPSYENVDTFADRLVHEGLLAREPVVDAVLQGELQDLSLRAVQLRFLRATGLTQRTVRQIERARRATALLVQGVPILDTVYETGYFDQAHMTRSLKRFMGKTPAQIAGLKPLP